MKDYKVEIYSHENMDFSLENIKNTSDTKEMAQDFKQLYNTARIDIYSGEDWILTALKKKTNINATDYDGSKFMNEGAGLVFEKNSALNVIDDHKALLIDLSKSAFELEKNDRNNNRVLGDNYSLNREFLKELSEHNVEKTMSEEIKDAFHQFYYNDHSSNQKLNEAVIEQMGGFEPFSENAKDISNHGIDAGFSGFIYHNDTVSFAQKNRQVILDALKEDAREFGHESVPEMMTHWKSLDGYSQDEIAEALYSNDESHEAHTTVYNAMAWYAGEKASHEYVNIMDELDSEYSKEYEFDSLGDAVMEHYAGEKLENPVYELEEKLNDLNVNLIDIQVDQDDKSLSFTATNLFDSPETVNVDVTVNEDGITLVDSNNQTVQFTLEEADNVSEFLADQVIGKNYEMQYFSGEHLETFQSRDVDEIMDKVNQLENGNDVYIHHGDEPVAYISIEYGEAKAQFMESDKAEHAGLFNALESQSKEMEFFHLKVNSDTKQEVQQKDNGMEMD